MKVFSGEWRLLHLFVLLSMVSGLGASPGAGRSGRVTSASKLLLRISGVVLCQAPRSVTRKDAHAAANEGAARVAGKKVCKVLEQNPNIHEVTKKEVPENNGLRFIGIDQVNGYAEKSIAKRNDKSVESVASVEGEAQYHGSGSPILSMVVRGRELNSAQKKALPLSVGFLATALTAGAYYKYIDDNWSADALRLSYNFDDVVETDRLKLVAPKELIKRRLIGPKKVNVEYANQYKEVPKRLGKLLNSIAEMY